MRASSPLDDLAERYFDAHLRLDPVSATFVGVPGLDHLLTDYGPAGHAARADLARATLREVDAQPVTDGVDAVTAALLRERLGQQVAEDDAGVPLQSLNNIACPVQHLREVFDVAPTATVADWEAIAERLATLPTALDGYRESLTLACDRGWSPAVRQVRAVEQQAAQFSAVDGFFPTLVADPPEQVPPALRDRLTAAADTARGAYGDLASWIGPALRPHTRDDDAVGADAYRLLAPGFLGTSIDVEETYAFGVAELERVERRIGEVCARLAPDATGDLVDRIDAGIAALDADPRRWVEGKETFRTWMQTLSDQAVSALGGTHFDIPEPLRTLRCRIAPSTSGGVYYTAPSEDFSRPGQMWWAVPEGVDRFSTWRETSTVYHEGVPGHHLQLGHTVHLGARLNRWRRLGVWLSGHGEGWALYAERLMEELGYLVDDGDLVGMLDAHALRAARVVVDIGVHCRLPAPAEVGGGTWDAAKAWEYLSRHTRMPEPSRRFELERYLGWPGQAIAYKVGERAWLALRARVEQRDGAAFDLKAFHRTALDLGPVGLDVLAGAVEAA